MTTTREQVNPIEIVERTAKAARKRYDRAWLVLNRMRVSHGHLYGSYVWHLVWNEMNRMNDYDNCARDIITDLIREGWSL